MSLSTFEPLLRTAGGLFLGRTLILVAVPQFTIPEGGSRFEFNFETGIRSLTTWPRPVYAPVGLHPWHYSPTLLTGPTDLEVISIFHDYLSHPYHKRG